MPGIIGLKLCGKRCMDQSDGRGQTKKQHFPLEVMAFPGGWGVVVYLENGKTWNLLKPGWQEEKHQPYLFETSDEAWRFLKEMFMFCLKQHHAKYLEQNKIINCDQCGRIFRARFSSYCPECLQRNEFMLQQIWQGFYYRSGSDEEAFKKLSMLLKIPVEQLQRVHSAFGTMVNRNLEWQIKEQTQAGRAEKSGSGGGMHSASRRQREML